ncbi:MAG: hypothetical protein NG712_02875 [Omnitrophica bacterium]|nr:hypothetical protein [Candidatus Omnitrophota bacterium]
MAWKVKKTEDRYLVCNDTPMTKDLWMTYSSKKEAREMVNNLNSFGDVLDE